jgi:hypothetical protein
MTSDIQLRYSFTAQFLRGAAILANRAHHIENEAGDAVSDEVQAEHRSYIIGTVIQCAAGLEAEISEIVQYGPGHHLGSNGIDESARAFLQPLAEMIDSQQTVKRYELVLHLLGRPPLDRGRDPHQATTLLIRVRNELVHYKSKWEMEMDQQKLFVSLRHLKLERPPFISPTQNFFPHQCLNASLASWSVATTVAFMDSFYSALGITSPLKAHEPYLVVPSARITGATRKRAKS